MSAATTPMVVAAARVLCKRGAEQCNVDFEDSWKIYGDDYLNDAQEALSAAGVPELLEALQRAEEVILSMCGFLPGNGDVAELAARRLREPLGQIEAAIAKTTGAQHERA